VTRAPLRISTATALAATLAFLVGGAARARAQDSDDDDLDKIPTETHHVVRPHDETAPAPSEDEEPSKPAPRPEPVHAAPPPEEAPAPRPAAHEREEEEAPPRSSAHAKRDRRHKHAKKKKSRHHGKARHEEESSEQPASPPPEAPPSEPRVLHANPAASEGGDEDAPPTVERSAPAEPGEGEARRPAESSGDMDFNLLPQKSQENDEATAIGRRIRVRRTMLQVHQGFGIATAALMAGTVITGQLNYSDRFGGGGSTGQYELWHDTFEAATVVSFATAGLLAVFAPTPFEHKSSGVDTVTVHKYSMLISTIGMAAEVPLGIWTVTREGYTNQGTLALTHLVIGYVTAAALTAGATALFF
jgi:hypothetical protein